MRIEVRGAEQVRKSRTQLDEFVRIRRDAGNAGREAAGRAIAHDGCTAASNSPPNARSSSSARTKRMNGTYSSC